MQKTKHPYSETVHERIERLATGAVTDGDKSQQLALVSLLHAFSEAAGKRDGVEYDVESLINHAMYCAFKETDSLHDEAIAWTIAAAEEDRADKIVSKNLRRA